MTMTSLKASRIAAKAHAGQVDKNGAAYFEHVKRVAHAVYAHATAAGKSIEETDALAAVAYLHDMVEDTGTTLHDLLDDGVDLSQLIALRALTRHEDEEYSEYIDRLILCPMARLVKLADLHDNLDPVRVLTGGSRSLTRRYTKAYSRVIAAEFDGGL